MAVITKQELLKIAQISQLRLYDEEVAPLMKQIADVLTYAERVKEIAAKAEVSVPSMQNVNVLREDSIIKTDADLILSLAPEHEAHFFMVPKILDTK